jgi:hypothetical protein
MIEVSHLTYNDSRGSYTPMPLNVLNEKWDQCSISVEGYIIRQTHHRKNTLKWLKVPLLILWLIWKQGKLIFVK